MQRILLLLFMTTQMLTAQEYTVYLGTFSEEGIFVFDFKDGELNQTQKIATQPGPSFLALHPTELFLYAANRGSVDPDQPKHGSLSAFSINPQSGQLSPLNDVTSMGNGACHVAVNPQGNTVGVANYGAGNVTWYALAQDGRIGKRITHIQHRGASVTDRQKGPHAHSMIPTQDGRFWYVSDLGLDAVITYAFKNGQFEEKSRIEAVPGSGPRHFKLSSDERFAYSIEELSSTVQVLKVKSSGKLKAKQRITTLTNVEAEQNFPSDIHVHPNEKFVIGANRGGNTLVVYTVLEDGSLKFLKQQPCGGNWPRNFGFSPDGNYLIVANQYANEIVVFQVSENMDFKEINRLTIPEPACVIWRE